MREHQIVITLKPEQFQEVQRLARAAGAKSMGMFVRQKLLLALGIEHPSPKKETTNRDLRQVLSELRRLHAELKVFVGEALCSSYQVVGAGQADGAKASGQSVLGIGDNLLVTIEEQRSFARWLEEGNAENSSFVFGLQDSSTFEHDEDELEMIAKKTFATSPRLGALETPYSTDVNESKETKQAPPNHDPLEELLVDEEPLDSKGSAVQNDVDVFAPDTDDQGDEEQTVVVKLPGTNELSQGKPSPKNPLPSTPPLPPNTPQGPANLGLSGGPPPRKRR